MKHFKSFAFNLWNVSVNKEKSQYVPYHGKCFKDFYSLVSLTRSLRSLLGFFSLHRNSWTKFEISCVCTVGQTQLPDKFQVFFRKWNNRQSGLGKSSAWLGWEIMADEGENRTTDRKKQISGRVSDSNSFKMRKLSVNFWWTAP